MGSKSTMSCFDEQDIMHTALKTTIVLDALFSISKIYLTNLKILYAKR